MDVFPVGPSVATHVADAPDPRRELAGKQIRIRRPDPGNDADELFAATHGEDADPGQWTYMSFGPFADRQAMRAWMNDLAPSSDPDYRVVDDLESGKPVGMVSFLNIERQHRTIELGNIWYTPAAQRSRVNTEAMYLLLGECFDQLGYRRVEWKCDALNARSRAAALRLGFSFEGIFRQHLIVKGRNRDTAWYAMLDGDWPGIRANFERSLYDPSCQRSLRELNE